MPNNTTVKMLEQGRAKFAYDCAKETIDLNKKNNELLRKAYEKKFSRQITPPKNDNSDKPEKDKNKEFLDDFFSSPKDTLNKKEQGKFEKDVISYYKKYQGEYKSYIRKIPMMIKTNGLGASLAFVRSKAKDENAYKLIYKQIGDWLETEQKKYLFETADKNATDLVDKIISLKSQEYRAVTIEVLAFIIWLRRFVDGLIEEEADNE